MYSHHMFPAFPKINKELERLSVEIISRSAQLGRGLNPKLVKSISEFMMNINSYYTNAMEGNPSLLNDIQAALNKHYSTDEKLRNYQLEHMAHISTQREMIERLENEKDLDVCSIDFLCWIHKEFYSKLPDELCYAHTRSGEKIPVLPGVLRDRPSSVGQHLPPVDLDEVRGNLNNFQRCYSLKNVEETKKVVALAASHHRLLWIHPFRDGNGRVARLFTIAYQHQIGVGSNGLWTITRAFARNRSEYDKHLSLADRSRRNDFDGRGLLSEEDLTLFCTYFLKECIDQLKFMESTLELHEFERRFENYLGFMVSQKKISKKSVEALREMFFRGEIKRGDIQKICSVKKRRATAIIKNLLENYLITSNSPHGPLRLYFSDESAAHLFPKLV
ncbi:MAG: Fic family protein [Pseudomonadota bacterium]